MERGSSKRKCRKPVQRIVNSDTIEPMVLTNTPDPNLECPWNGKVGSKSGEDNMIFSCNAGTTVKTEPVSFLSCPYCPASHFLFGSTLKGHVRRRHSDVQQSLQTTPDETQLFSNILDDNNLAETICDDEPLCINQSNQNGADSSHISKIWDSEFKQPISKDPSASSRHLGTFDMCVHAQKVSASKMLRTAQNVQHSKKELDILQHIKEIPLGNEKVYACDLCPKTYKSKQSVVEHYLTVHSTSKDNPFKCDICGKGFSSKSYIAKHMRSHTGETPYECQICQKKFSFRSTLNNHLKSHATKVAKGIQA